jgi:threonine dehydrogenase-like Zn-dependent dehydrogenase
MPFINADLVIEAAGTNRAIESSFKAVRAGGEVVLLGVPDKPINNFDFADVVVRDISIYGVLNGPGKYNEALSLIAERVIDANKIIDQVVEFGNFSHAISLALNRERQLPKILISM